LLCDRLHKYEAALRDFREAQKLDDKAWRPYANEAIALFRLRRMREAIEALDGAIARTDDAPQPAYLKGEWLLPLGEYEEATEAFLLAIERAPKWVNPWWGLVHALEAQGPWDRGLAKAVEALERFPDDLYFQDARVYFLRALGQTAVARDLAREYVARGRANDGPLYFAYLCAAAGDADRARKILARMRLDGGGHFSAACIHAVCGDAEAALTSLEAAAGKGHRTPPNTLPDPDLEALLKDNARYQDIMKKLASR
jgi:tetratricopeptide (TPR) repeat protein